MIVSECGDARSASQVMEHLAECGARVMHTFQVIPGVAAGLSPDAVRKFFARYPDAKVLVDRRRQIPPRPFGPDELAEAAGPSPGVGIRTSPTQPEVSPLALTLIKADEVHARGIDGTGVRVCVIDSGVDFNHPDLLGIAIPGPDGQPLAADFTETDLTDTIGHGTAVAGCIASQARQVFTIYDEQSKAPVAYTRIKGVAPGVRLMSAKVFDARVPSGYDSSIIAALEWAAANGAHIINMSLGGVSLPNDGTDLLAAAVTALRDRGVLVVVAAGNSGGGRGTVESPGCSPGAFTVGASTMYRSFAELGFLAEPEKWTADQLASFSSQGPVADGRVKPDILAPGAFDWGLAPTSDSEEGQSYQLFGGTSQASPLVAGAAALIYQVFQKQNSRYPTPVEAAALFRATADDLGLPAHMQGPGRVNCLRAVQAISGETGFVTVDGPVPAVVTAGRQGAWELVVSNVGRAEATVPLQALTLEEARDLSQTFTGEIAPDQSPQHLLFDVPAGVDALHLSLDWMTEDHSPRSPRLMLAIYDPDGRFVNYQRPNGSGDVELGKNVDTWVARPAQGQWKARVVLRLGVRDTRQPFTLAIRAYQRKAWDWAEAAAEPLTLAPGGTTRVAIPVRVPGTVTAGTYTGQLLVGSAIVPAAVVVPVSLEQGKSTFAGAFEHGYQGSWGNGDWHYHDLPVPAGTRSLVTSIQWPDVDNSLEFYLIDPSGNAVMSRSNSDDILADGDSNVQGGQIVLAGPEPGTWRLALHSFAFCGRGSPEPYTGLVEVGGELVSPHAVEARVTPGERAPLALLVRNPGRMPLTVVALVQAEATRLIWQNITEQIASGVTTEGHLQGQGPQVVGTLKVPFGARQIGVSLTWDRPDVEVSLSLFDPVAQNDRITASTKGGQVMVMESNPVHGQWTAVAGIVSPTAAAATLHLKGATFVVAPQEVEEAVADPVTIQPGATAIVPLSIRMPEAARALAGRIVVTTTSGDRLGDVDFRLLADEPASPN